MKLRSLGTATFFSLLPSLALAAPPSDTDSGGGVSLGASASASTDSGASASGDASGDASGSSSGGKAKGKASGDDEFETMDRKEVPWIRRWRPERNMVELGVMGGAMWIGKNHELFHATFDRPDQGYKPFQPVSGDFGIRVSYLPLRFFGVEAEGSLIPSPLSGTGNGEALVYTVRGHFIAQLPYWSVTPFVVVGAGALGVSSPPNILGKDVDPAMHFGGGLKVYINRNIAARLDLRDVVTYKQSIDSVFVGHNPELLVGLSITLNRKKHEGPYDRDHDGIMDDEDSCPDQAETVNDYQDEDGCPEKDSDGDGFYDDQDTCPNEAETVNDYEDEDGCPEKDSDGDGFWDDKDSCPNEAETVNDYKDEDGCPEQDPDNDRFFDDQDQCPTEPESDNGYKDDDGCPDEVPEAIAAFTGTIQGITFENDSDKIRKSSDKTLDQAVEVLMAHPDIRIKVGGHTDNKGEREHNLDLSKRRAESVKAYLVSKGVDDHRIETEGFGPDKPVDTNDTSKGRANNRRIEFEILKKAR